MRTTAGENCSGLFRILLRVSSAWTDFLHFSFKCRLPVIFANLHTEVKVKQWSEGKRLWLSKKFFLSFYSSVAFLCVLKHFNNGNAVPMRSGSFSTMRTAFPRVPPRNDPDMSQPGRIFRNCTWKLRQRLCLTNHSACFIGKCIVTHVTQGWHVRKSLSNGSHLATRRLVRIHAKQMHKTGCMLLVSCKTKTFLMLEIEITVN